MKVLHIIPSLQKGGAERLTLDICIQLSKHPDIEVSLLTFSPINEYFFLSKQINHNIIPSKAIPSISGKPTIQINELVSFIKIYQPDVIHSHLFEAEMVSRWMIFPNITYFSHCHDNMHQFQNFSFYNLFSKKRITELYEKQLIKKRYIQCQNQFIAISTHTQNYFKLVLPKSLSRNVHLLHNGIDIGRFGKINKAKKDYKKLVLINIGSFVPNKNQLFLVDVLYLLIQNNINVRMSLLGNGPQIQCVRNKIIQLHLNQFVDIPGNVSNVEDYLSQSDIYLHSAKREAFGLTIIEAMASGLPVITLNGGGNADIIENGKNGFLINEQNPRLFADKVLEIWKNKELYLQMSQYAQQYAKKFDIKEYVEKLLELYQQALKG
jgi:glycosyltransferase involved in cell wall biosynthesis